MASNRGKMPVPRSALRALASGYDFTKDERGLYILAVARGAHEELCGSWEAAGFETKEAFVMAAERMVEALADQGLDLFSFPGHGWRTG